MEGSESRRTYVEKVREETHRYGEELLRENERLRKIVAALRGERGRLEEQLSSVEETASENEALKGLVALLERDKSRLQEQVLKLRRDADRRDQEQLRLREELAEIEDRSRMYAGEFAEVERQNSNLANLYVASYSLHAALDRDQVLAIIQEILANLVGSEEIAIFEIGRDGRTLELLLANGVDADRYRTVQVGEGPIGRVAAEGEASVLGSEGTDERPPEEPRLTACVPLILDGRVSGAIAVFGLLPQKPRLVDLDFELLELLGTHAATALYCASLHARVGASQTARPGGDRALAE